MKNYVRISIIVWAALCGPSIGLSVVKEPEERQAKIKIANQLLSKKVVLPEDELIASIGDPFAVSPDEEVVVAEEVVEEKVSAKELIPLLAKNVNPTGVFTIGGEYYLMFKEDKVKAGETIAVLYKNKEYNLKIVNVLRNAFSLRLEDAELEIKLK